MLGYCALASGGAAPFAEPNPTVSTSIADAVIIAMFAFTDFSFITTSRRRAATGQDPATEHRAKNQSLPSYCVFADPIAYAAPSQLIIHGTPKRSVTMPKPAAQKVFWNGMQTFPPSANALKMRSPFFTSFSASETEKPCSWL